MNVMIGQCLEFNQCAPWWLGYNRKTRMIGIPYGPDITNSPHLGHGHYPPKLKSMSKA